MIECVSETIVFLYRKRTALPAPLCYEVLAAEVLGGRCTLQAHFRCTPSVSGSIPARRNSFSGIIFPMRTHPCSRKFPVRDYFPEAKASLLEGIPRQGLFSQGKSIPARGNLPSWIICPRRKHPCSEKSPVRDYFPEAKASLLREIHRQGLFSQGGCIPVRRNLPSGIIFPRQKHPCSEKSPVRDYFPETKASLLEEISRHGLFARGESIPARRNLPSGIIFSRQKHPCSKKSTARDYSPEAKASLLREISRQGLFSRGESIPAQRNSPSGIIFSRRMHPCSEKSPVRDYFLKAKASLLEEISRQGLFSRGGLFARNHIQTSAEPGEHKLMSTNHTLSAGGQPHSRLPQRLKQVLSFLPALLIMVAIFRFSSQNADDSSTESIRITQELLCVIRDRLRLSWTPSQLSLYIERSEFFIRKLAHFSEYAALGLSLILPLCAFYSGSFKKKTPFLTSWIICIAYAASDELHQFFSPGRSPQIRDVVIDSFGALAGILLGLLLIRIRRSLRNRK